MANMEEMFKLLGTVDSTAPPTMNKKQEQEFHKSKAPVLTGRHVPSTASLTILQAIGFKDLKQGSRHEKKVIYLTIQGVKISNGMTLTVKDSEGRSGLVWSLIVYQFPGGEKSVSANTLIAVREPYLGIDVNGALAICVHHPTDILRISKYDPAVSKHFPNLAGLDHEDFEKAGNTAFVLGNLLDAIDIYTEGIKRAGPIPPEEFAATDSLMRLVNKRAFTCFRLELYQKALTDALDIIQQRMYVPKDVRLVTTITIKAGKYLGASNFTEGLLIMEPDNDANHKLGAEANAKLQQSRGKIDLNEVAKSMKHVHDVADVADFLGDFQIRSSKLHGRGAFATSKIKQGELILCEKPIAIQHDHIKSSFAHGLKGFTDREDGWVSQNELSFLQALATAASKDPSVNSGVFMHFGGARATSTVSDDEAFDIYRALDVAKYNSHRFNPGNASNMHNVHDPQYDGPYCDYKPSRALCAITSFFNHSCVPNGSYAWVANLMVVRANRDIEPDEEITLTYVDPDLPWEGRLKALESYRIICYCGLCAPDDSLALANKSQIARRLKIKIEFISSGQSFKTPKKLEMQVRNGLATYNHPGYEHVPFIGLGMMMLVLGHAYLGPLKAWPKGSKEAKSKASLCFNATLELCLGIRVVKDPHSAYCELSFSKYSQPMPSGILALVGLAELAHLSGGATGMTEVSSILKCAKLVYKLRYGQDATFHDHHKQYRCTQQPLFDALTKPENWDVIKTTAISTPKTIPDFLR